MKFYYKARDKDGEIREGEVEASSKDSASLVVENYGLYVVSLEEIKVPFYKRELPPIFERASGKDIVMISRQLAVMAESKIPIVEALQVLARQIEKKLIREKILSVSDKVEGGMPFSKALSYHPDVFSEFYVSMIKSGEVSGKLSEALRYLADHIEREYKFQQKIKGAMFYPIFILVVFLGIMIFLFVGIMPDLTGMLLEAEGELPFITEIVVAFSDFLVEQGWIVTVGVYSFVVFSIKFFTTKQGREAFDRFVLKAPVLREFFKKTYIIRFAESFSTLITAGVPIVKSLEISAEIVQNVVYKEAILDIAKNVEKGRQVSESMRNHPEIFSPMLIQMSYVGEKSGRLGSSLLNVVDFLQDELQRTLDKYISLIEPAMIITLGVLVGGLVAAVLIPIYNISMSM